MAKGRYLQNLPDLRRKLEKLKRDTSPKVRVAMEQAAGVITNTMRALVPVDDGDLRASIGWTDGKAPKGSLSETHRAGDLAITIFAGDEKAFYARWVEFGTAEKAAQAPRQNKNWKRKVVMTRAYRGHAATQAKPFFYPAYRAHRKDVLAGMRKAIRSAVKEAVQ